jgi:microcin C transport system substrate-binding protein
MLVLDLNPVTRVTMHNPWKKGLLSVSALLLLVTATVAPSAHAEPSHGISPFGELKYPWYFKHFKYVNPKAPKGGTLKLGYSIAFDSLNPFILKGVPAPGMDQFYESLMTPALDEPQSYYGLIAESIDIATDRSYADFTLRPNARWHDGKEITSEDVVFSFNILKGKGHPSYRILYQPIEKVEMLGKRQVRFHFSDTTLRELPLLAASMPILPAHYYAEHEFDKTTLKAPVGSGPYRVKHVDQGRSISYERVDDYWGKYLPVNTGQHNFDIIHYDIYRDETVGVEALKAGRYDFREEYIARNWATAYNIPAVKEERLIKKAVPHKIPRGMQAFLFNLRQSKFSDARVREAIGLSMDFQWMNETLFYGAYSRNTSFFQSTDFMATGLPSEGESKLLEPYKDQLPPALFDKPFVLPQTDGSGYPRANLLKAQTLLEEAGWVLRDGIRVNEQTGEILTVEFMMRQRTFERVVGSMIRNLKKLGITASFRFVDDSQYQKRIDSRDFDVISIWWNLGVFFPGNEQISYWHSGQADIAGGNNLSGLKSPVVDHLLGQLTQAHTLDQLTPAARALDRVLLWNHIIIPHWHISSWRLLYWDKFGRPDITPDYGIGLESWWSKEAEK